MDMAAEARLEKSETAAESYPIIVRSYEPVGDLDERLERIVTVLSLAPPEELKARRPRVAHAATGMTGDSAEPPVGTGSGDRCGDSEGDSGAPRQVRRSV
jgi:hypothetical protein